MRRSAHAIAAALALAPALAGAVMFSPAASASSNGVSPNFTCSVKFKTPYRTGNYVYIDQDVECPKAPASIENNLRLYGPSGKVESCENFDKSGLILGIDTDCGVKWSGHGWYHYSRSYHVTKKKGQGASEGGAPLPGNKKL